MRLKSDLERYNSLASKLEPVDALEERVSTLESEYEALAGASREVHAGREMLERMTSLQLENELAGSTAAFLKDLAAPPELEDTDAIETIMASIDTVGRQCAALERTAALLKGLVAAPELGDVETLQEMVDDLARVKGECAFHAASAGAVQDLQDVVELDDGEALSDMIDAMEREREVERAAKSSVAVLEKGLALAARDVEDWVRDHGICPTCGAELDAGRLLSGDHAHD